MDIVVSDAAQNYLNSLIVDDKVIRIRAINTNSCSTWIEYDLVIDEVKNDDKTTIINSLIFAHDNKAEEEIGPYLKIDYVPSQGFKLINKNQTLAYGLSLRNK